MQRKMLVLSNFFQKFWSSNIIFSQLFNKFEWATPLAEPKNK